MPLPREQIGMGHLSPEAANPGGSMRSLLSRLFSGWGSNNAAGAASSPYNDVSAVGLRDAVRLPGADVAAAQTSMLPTPVPAMGEQLIDITPPPATVIPALRQPRRARSVSNYDEDGMQQLVDSFQSPVEGPNANIDDATRQRALLWAMRNNQG